MHYYGILLEDFNNNGEFVNDCIFTMMHHIGGDLGQIGVLFQPIILKTYSRIWEADYELCDVCEGFDRIRVSRFLYCSTLFAGLVRSYRVCHTQVHEHSTQIAADHTDNFTDRDDQGTQSGTYYMVSFHYKERNTRTMLRRECNEKILNIVLLFETFRFENYFTKYYNQFYICLIIMFIIS